MTLRFLDLSKLKRLRQDEQDLQDDQTDAKSLLNSWYLLDRSWKTFVSR